ncbi:MAG: response regulator transcription factor [Anaerolineae bacterium]|jgi:two-component system alkaline phosphatase synthesis response regulator PhoP|nr:response regulator transcription factor [Chloroflexota bacterium]MBN8634566.1 response regulator transcription factor [Anaerolineae bacterium]
MYEIMIVDDDAQVLDMVELVLKREGYHVLRAFSAKSALETIENETPDLFVIDAMMPDMDGLTLCRRLRAMPRTTNTPIIFLTGNNSPHTVVDALNSGGDDFIRKPFVPRELAARVRAHIRRSVFYSDGDVAAIRIQSNRYRVYVNDAEVLLTRVEFDLLKYLCTSPYRLHSTEELLANVWQYPDGVGDAALVRNHVHNLRRKIEIDPERPLIIQSRHGRGYVVKARIQFEDETIQQ